MLKSFLIFFVILLASFSVQSKTDLWSAPQHKSMSAQNDGLKRTYLDTAKLSDLLVGEGVVQIELPSPSGELLLFNLTPYSVMPKSLAEKYPEIKTYIGVQANNPAVKGTFDYSPNGFFGVYDLAGKRVFIEPKMTEAASAKVLYRVYYKYAIASHGRHSDYLLREPRKHNNSFEYRAQRVDTPSLSTPITNDLKYRLAIATTGEYAQFHGGTKSSVMAALVTLVNRVNQVYMRDLSTSFELVESNDELIFLDASADPFANESSDIDEITAVIDARIGVSGYDIGHLVGTGAGGLAGFGVACGEAKAEGITGNPQPINDAFAIDYVAHEIGHQLGADHTFNGQMGACESSNHVAGSAFEPGSGSTIMGYTGICEAQNLQASSDPYFHIHSIEQMATYTRQGGGSSCGVRNAKANQMPIVNAGDNYTIPARTPFKLTGSATDADGDSLTYSWQQYDLGSATNSPQEDAIDRGTGPLFRVFNPTESSTRTFPKMSDVLSGSVSYGEALPTTSRTLNFRLLVRDGTGNIADDAMTVTVIGNQQGFSVQEPSDNTEWTLGTQTVRWHTADTQNAPVSCSSVDILLSLDGGETFPTLIADDVTNDGEHDVALSGLASSSFGKIKIMCSNNVFFAVNSGNIQIQGSTEPVAPHISEQETLEVAEDTSITLSISNFKYQGGFNAESLTISSGNNYTASGLTVTPAANFNGTLTVPLTATRGELTSDTYNATITVTAVNDAPTAQNDSFTVNVNSQSNLFNVLNNDSDIDGDALSIGTINYQGTGSVSVSNNQLSYTPAADFSGTEQLTYVVRDASGAESTAQVAITVSVPQSSDSGSSGGIFYLIWMMVALPILRAVPGRGN
ncbi:reprolysin-like metallopeptidase [Pseudoalteromonas luteoviolacea]|uniref:reprolysin-like metallopeptidase n=1 Tax=Pseudoalteromonas luteoviolacea TaxID=43657 RepID=UPI001B386503|nr:Ig-like domain-containing protein [Pseudoalteromonas luteoviolacea]MBQ4837895.1 cadherin-like domain-containing protein [Pseudoalteromonas luteoviolacea]